MDNRDRENREMRDDRDLNRDGNSLNRENRSFNDDDSRLKFLTDLDDYKVASDDPDVRGWTVVDASNHEVGKVDNLLVDMTREKVRYLDVDLNKDLLGKDHEPLASNDPSGVHEYEKDGDVHMIVPIGLARLDVDNKKVISDEINSNIIRQGHFHRKGQHISPDYERRVVSAISTTGTTSSTTETNRPATSQSEYGSSVQGRTENRTANTGRDSVTSRGDSETYDLRNTNDRKDLTGDRHDERRNPESSRGINPDTGSSERRDDSSRMPSDREAERGTPTDERRNREPIQDDFYNNDYFDDRKFYGRRK